MTTSRKRRMAGQLYDPNELLRKTKLRVDEAASLLEVSPRSIERYMDDGKLQFALTPGGRRRVIVESLRKYL